MNLLPTIEPNTSAVAFLVVIICVGFGAILILVSRYFNLWQVKRIASVRFSPKKFRELAARAEFTDEESDFLENYLRQVKISRSLELFYEYRFGQSIMRQIYRSTYSQPQLFACDIELARSYIFYMVQKLENFLQRNIFANRTRKIPEGSRFYLELVNKEQNAAKDRIRIVGKLRSNNRRYFEVNLLNGRVKDWPKGSKVKIELMKQGDRAIYESRVKAHSSNRRYKNSLIMEHSRRPKIILGARRYNRKQLQTSATIIPLRQEGSNFIANGETMNTLLCDISMTGCGVLSYIKLPRDSFIGVSYLNPYDNNTVKFICRIMGHSKLRNTNIDAVILQNRIERIEYRDQNLICAFVYEFEQENEKIRKLAEDQNSSISTFDNDTIAILQGRSS